MDARGSDYDYGLVIINQVGIPGGRYASNGLYITDDPSGYSNSLKGSERAVEGQTVCKVGITTDYTCGTVIDAFERDGLAGEITIEVQKRQSYDSDFLIGQGDSGGALFDPSDMNFIGIASKTSTDKKIDNTWYGYTGYFTPFVDAAQKYGTWLYTNSVPTLITDFPNGKAHYGAIAPPLGVG